MTNFFPARFVRFFSTLLISLPPLTALSDTNSPMDLPDLSTFNSQDDLRIVTTTSAHTEILYALDAEEYIVGVDTSSYYPIEAQSLPTIGYQRALALEGILSLEPSLLILNNEAGPPSVVSRLKQSGITTININRPKTPQEIMDAITTLAHISQREKQGKHLIQELKIKEQQLKSTIQNLNPENKPRILVLLSQSVLGTPLAAGRNTPGEAIIELAGGVNAVNNFYDYKNLTPEALLALDPDVVIVTTRILDPDSPQESLDDIVKQGHLHQLRAYKEGKMLLLDTAFVLSFGPRLLDAALRIQEVF